MISFFFKKKIKTESLTSALSTGSQWLPEVIRWGCGYSAINIQKKSKTKYRYFLTYSPLVFRSIIDQTHSPAPPQPLNWSFDWKNSWPRRAYPFLILHIRCLSSGREWTLFNCSCVEQRIIWRTSGGLKRVQIARTIPFFKCHHQGAE